MKTPKIRNLQELELPHAANAMDFSNDGTHLAVGLDGPSGGSAVRILSTKNGGIVAEVPTNKDRSQAVAFTNGGETLHYITWDTSNRSKLWKFVLATKKSEMVEEFSANETTKHLARDADGRFLAAFGKIVYLWDLKKNRQVNQFTGKVHGQIRYVCFAKDSPKMFVSGLDKDHVLYWDPIEEEELARWSCPEEPEQVVVSPDQRFLAIAGSSFTGVALHDLKTKKQITHDTTEIVRFNDAMKTRAIAFTSDSRYMTMLRNEFFVATLPEVTSLQETPDVPGARASVSASANNRNLLAFSIQEERRIIWFELH